MARTLALLNLILLAACQGGILAGDLPAVVNEYTPESHAELVRVISKALNGRSVTLAQDVLMDSDKLVIERKPQRNLQGRIDGGRVLEPPEQFRLVINGVRCELIHLHGEPHSELRLALRQTRCRKL
ncbi:MAG TPA: hypothetical protein EYG63_03430 [Gammaproteobacteria bacterium]|nr:hypothetical protein [Gammaproteobacteria bacterium]